MGGARHADALLPLSQNQAEALRAAYQPRGMVRAIRTAIDCDFFHLAQDAPHASVLAVGDDVSRDYATLLAMLERYSLPVQAALLEDVIRRLSNP